MTEPGSSTETVPATSATPATPSDPGPQHGFRARVRRFRSRVRARPRLNVAYRIGVGVVGTAVLILGIIAIPYPGPGWLIVFAGLGILATEFTWAGRLLRFARGYYDRWAAWVRRQNVLVKLLLALATFVIVVATVWLLNGFGLVAGWVGLESWTWLKSPLLA